MCAALQSKGALTCVIKDDMRRVGIKGIRGVAQLRTRNAEEIVIDTIVITWVRLAGDRRIVLVVVLKVCCI